MTRRGGRLPDPGLAAICARCGEPREAHGGARHLGACPGESGLYARRFQLREEDKAREDEDEDVEQWRQSRTPASRARLTGASRSDKEISMASVTTATATTTISIDGGAWFPGEVEITRSVEYVRSELAVKPDPDWSHTDSNGHFHAFTKGVKRAELPTLRTEQIPCDGACGDPEHTVPEYHCRICGDVIEPGYVPDYTARGRGIPIPGPKSATITVHADGPISTRTVSLRVKHGDMELIGIGDVVSTSSYGVSEIVAKFVEPRLSA